MSFIIDVDERRWSRAVMQTLLLDRTTGKNIVWATSDYQVYGREFAPNCQLQYHALIADVSIIQPRILKSLADKNTRTKTTGEVFTPSWMCNLQNNAIDAAWFGRAEVFNTPLPGGWKVNNEPIEFRLEPSKDWRAYVAEPRLEITCGEARYLVSRYDSVTGQPIPVAQRIGLLDRKLRVVQENTQSEAEWWAWTKVAYQSVYGFELHGDSLLIARENLLATFEDYLSERWKRAAYESELREIAEIISWNLWQMDGLQGTVPEIACTQEGLMHLFAVDDVDAEVENVRISGASSTCTNHNVQGISDTPLINKPACLIKDWQQQKIIKFNDLLQK